MDGWMSGWPGMKDIPISCLHSVLASSQKILKFPVWLLPCGLLASGRVAAFWIHGTKLHTNSLHKAFTTLFTFKRQRPYSTFIYPFHSLPLNFTSFIYSFNFDLFISKRNISISNTRVVWIQRCLIRLKTLIHI